MQKVYSEDVVVAGGLNVFVVVAVNDVKRLVVVLQMSVNDSE